MGPDSLWHASHEILLPLSVVREMNPSHEISHSGLRGDACSKGLKILQPVTFVLGQHVFVVVVT